MSNLIKYSTSQPTRQGIRKGNLIVGVGLDEYGPTTSTGYYNGTAPPNGGYIVYTLNGNNSPIMFAAADDAALIDIASSLGGGGGTIAGAKEFLCTRTSTFTLFSNPEDIVTEDNILNIDPSSISSYPGSGVDTMDLSGIGSDGTLTNGVAFGVGGFFEFDGVDDKIISGGTMDAAFTTQYWTVNIQFNIDVGYSSYNAMLGNGYPFQLYVFNGKVIAYLSSTVGSGTYFLSGMTSTQTISAGKWYDLAFVRDGTNYYYYINGTLDKSATSTTATMAAANQNLQIGNLWAASDAYAWEGKIGNVKIYSKSLTLAELNQNHFQSPIITDGLIYSIDAANLTSYQNGATTAYSLTGSNDSTLTNGIAFDSNNGGSWNFDGVDDYITLASTITNAIYTLDFWYKMGANDGGYGYFTNDASGLGLAVSEGGTLAGLSYGNLYYYNGSAAVKLTQTTLLTTGVWNNISVVIDTSSNNIKMYLNGNINANQSVSSMSTSVSEIGRYIPANVHFINGSMASFKIYNKELTSTEILQNYNATKSRYSEYTIATPPGFTFGNALQFDGVDDFVTLSPAITEGNTWFLSFWITGFTNTGGYVYLFGFDAASGVRGGIGMSIGGTAFGLQMGGLFYYNGSGITVLNVTVSNNTSWNHVAINATPTSIAVSLNGATSVNSSVAVPSNSLNEIGTLDSSQFGAITYDEIGFLVGSNGTTQNITDLYNSGNGQSFTTVMGANNLNLHLNESGTATVAIDSGGSGNDGTLNNFSGTYWVPH